MNFMQKVNQIQTGPCDKCGTWDIEACMCPDTEGDTIGGDMEPYSNPMQSHNDHGKVVPFTQSPTFVGPIFLNISSDMRDLSIYGATYLATQASFHLDFPPIRGIKSIEVVSFETTPLDVDGSALVNCPFIYLANGLGTFSSPNSSFTPQGLMKLFKPSLQPRNSTFVATGVVLSSVLGNCFARIPYNRRVVLTPSDDSEYISEVEPWQTGQTRFIHYFKPEHAILHRLEFTLVDNLGRVLQYPTDVGNFACTLCVTARQQ